MSSESNTELDIDALLDAPAGRGGLFDYQSGESFLHRMNPVTKLTLTGSFVTVALLSPSYRVPSILFGVTLMSCLLGGILNRVARLLGGLALPIAVSLLFFHGLFNPRNETQLFILKGVPAVERIVVWREGIVFALTILTPLLVLMVAILATVMTTHPKKLAISMVEKGLSPRFAYVFMAALQFIPEMREQAGDILDAQQARGLDVNANLYRRLRAFVDLLTPLLIGMLITTETRSLALESRGFTRRNPRTFLFEVPDRLVDRALRWLAGALVVGAVIWRAIAWL
jgi:energy-coupling factor transport system permease protein